MKIYEQEKIDGLEESLNSSASISYACVAEPYSGSKKDSKYLKSMASFNDEDLYYVQSILVSSSWNKNDDIFDKIEVWNAKNTPEHKPTNLEHDENSIIGHIISNWPITEDGILIDESTPIENLPDKYHILTGSVIYKSFSDETLRNRSATLISEIEEGTKYVSMECFFKGFDYGLLDKETNQYHILGRNEDTAYLTKFLRSYGGVGEHENYKIGRVLRNIIFSGKGFVNKPANEDSIIFSKNMPILENIVASINDIKQKNQEIVNSGVLDFQSNIQSESLIMSLETKIESDVNNVTVENSAESKFNMEELKNSMHMKTKELEALQSTYEMMKTEKEEEMAGMTQKMNDQEAMMKKQKEEMAMMMNKMKAELDEANDTIASYKNKEEEMMKKEKKMKRMAALIENGIDNESAEATVDKFESLDDDAFEAMTSLFAGKMPPWLEKIKKKKEDTKAIEEVSNESTEIKIDPSVLETAEVEATINLGVGSNDVESAIESTRAALVEFVCSKLGKKTK